MKINPREKKLLLAAAAGLAALLAYQVLAAPAIQWRRDIRQQAEELKADLLRCRVSLRQKDRIEAQYKAMAIDLRQRGSDEEEVARLLQDLRKKYGAKALTDKGAKVLPVEEGGFYRKFRLALELEGTTPALADFLQAVTTAAEPLKVERLTVRAVGARGSQEVIRGSVVVSAIYTLAGP